jgi:hypothetical protein
MSKARRRHKAREQFWRDTIAAWRESGQSVRAFRAARGVSEATFFARRRELIDRKPSGPSVDQPPAAGGPVRVQQEVRSSGWPGRAGPRAPVRGTDPAPASAITARAARGAS